MYQKCNLRIFFQHYFIHTIIGKLIVVEKNGILVYIGLPDSKLNFIKNWCKEQFNNANLNFIEFPKTKAKTQIEEYFAKKRYFSSNVASLVFRRSE